MKRFNLSLLILSLFGLSIISACNKDDVKTFTQIMTQDGGSWNVTYFKSQEFENDTLILEFDLSGGVVGTFIFNEDGTGSGDFLGTGAEPFNWTYSEASNEITISDDSTTTVYSILTNTETNQSWRSEETETIGSDEYRSVSEIQMQK